jgi:hypothetical protein
MLMLTASILRKYPYSLVFVQVRGRLSKSGEKHLEPSPGMLIVLFDQATRAEFVSAV